MADEETRKLIVTQPRGQAFAVAGSDADDPLNHRLHGDVVHRTDKPIVHMHLWDEDCMGRVLVRGDPEAPVGLRHQFTGVHQQAHQLQTALDAPIHHALQLRTPLQVRFCNTWHVASDYTVGVEYQGRSLFSIRLTGATIATPQPCPEDDCAPAPTKAAHP